MNKMKYGNEWHVTNLGDEEVLVIEGIRYSGALFKSMALFPIGTVVRIVGRDNGMLTVERLNHLSGNTPVQQATIEFEEERYRAAVEAEKRRFVAAGRPGATWARRIADALPFTITITKKGTKT